ncbi:MAG: FKBP-type peptidyl-prolyl cis-trans isomerase [Crocinitomicaceae bacterium]|nr:FKBP-type peptidyl-prolyl cis-trans isomerase [Crocinitomicaceae bacterium]
MTEEINAAGYCVGMSVAESLMQQDLNGINPSDIAEGIADVFNQKDLRFTPEEANGIIQMYLQRVNEEKFSGFRSEGENFLKENGAKEGIHTTASGLQYEVITVGNGKTPSEDDTVQVHYHGTLIDGSVFDSSIERNDPATFGVKQVIKGWTEALQLMPEGSKYRLFIPQDLAYGAHPHPGGPIKPFMTLIFEVELLKVH